MTPQDFAWMWQGIIRAPFKATEAHFLKPIDEHRGGKRRAILLLHGFSSSPAVFRAILPAFDEYDGMVAPLLPGHGESIVAFSQASAKDWIACAETHCQKLIKQYDQVDVLGLSLGGLLACHVEARFKLNHLYLLAPSLALTFPLNLGPFLPKLLFNLGIKTLQSHSGNLHARDYTELAYRKHPLRTAIELLSLIKTFHFTPPRCRTDLFLGSQDAVVASAKVESYFKYLQNVHIHWLKNSAHVLPLDADRKTIIDCVRKSSSLPIV